MKTYGISGTAFTGTGRTPWQARAKCRGIDDDGSDLFHPSVDHTAGTPSPAAAGAYEKARAFCRRCPVTLPCLQEAIRVEGTSVARRCGIWGGLSPTQRARLDPDATVEDLQLAIRLALYPPQSVDQQPPVSDRTDFTIDQMRAANRAYKRWRTRGGPTPDPDEMAAYRAYQRWRKTESRRAGRDARREAAEASRAEIARLVGQGLTQREIGDLLKITRAAVGYHVQVTRSRQREAAS